MMKKLFLIFAVLLSCAAAFAQINSLPATQGFTDAFSGTGNGSNTTNVTGQGYAFYTNYAGSEVQAAARIFRDATANAISGASLGIIPTGSHTTINNALKADVSFNLTNYSGVSVSFSAKSAKNGSASDLRPALLFMQTSIDGGATWSASTQIGTNDTFANAATAVNTYTYNFTANTSGAANVKLRFSVYRSGTYQGSSVTGNTAEVVIDDLNITGTYIGATSPSVSLSPASLTGFSQLDGFPSATQTAVVSGMYLTDNLNLAVTAPYQISLTATGTFGSSVSLTPASGTVTATNIYVRLNNAITGAATGTLTATATGATSAVTNLSGATISSASTNPAPFDLSTGNYVFNQWDNTNAAGTYPPNMALWTHNVNDPGINDLFLDNFSCAYNIASASRFVGSGVDGLTVVNTGSVQNTGVCAGTTATSTDVANGFGGAYVLAINTTGKENVLVDWTGRTVFLNTQQYALRLQYRIGAGNVNLNWQDIPSGGNAYTQYAAGANGSSASFTTQLPDETDNQPVVQLRWVYYRIAGTSNSRSQLTLDDITVYPAPLVATPQLSTNISSLSFYQVLGFTTASQQFTVSGTTLTGDVTLTTTAPYEISLTADGAYSTSLIVPSTDGALAETVIYVRMNSATAGTFAGNIIASSAGAPDKTVVINGVTEASTATNPVAFDLSTGDYLFTEWAASSAAGTYPANMAFWQHSTTDPHGTEYFMANYSCLYNLTTGSRIDGQGANGVSMINTSDSQDGSVCQETAGTPVAYGKNGAMVLALNTTGKTDLKINWTGRTIVKNPRTYALRLQYRIGTQNNNPNAGWQDIASGEEAFTQYANGDTGTAAVFTTSLPVAAENQSLVQLRWMYNEIIATPAASGARSEVALDDVLVYSAAVPQPQVTLSSGSFTFNQVIDTPSSSQVLTVLGNNLTEDIALQVAAPFEISLSLESGYTTSLNLIPVSGSVSSTDIYIRLNNTAVGQVSQFLTVATAGAATANITLAGNTIGAPITNPAPFILSGGNYTFTSWTPASAAGSYPANMVFWTHAVTDPLLTTPFTENFNCLYNLTGRSRFYGEGNNGISMINTGNAQFSGVCDGSNPTQNSGSEIANGRSGAIVLALNTNNRQNVSVSWTGRTILKNNRVYGLRMQYRVGAADINSGWLEIPAGSTAFTEYVTGENNTAQNIVTQLPADANNQPVVQVRWVYYYKSGTGSRAQIGLDDVTVTSEELTCFYTTVWDGTTWNNGTPNSNLKAEFAANYTATVSLTACEVNVTNNAQVTFVPGTTLTANNKITVAEGASLVFENNAALLQSTDAAINSNSGAITIHKSSNPLYRLDYTMWSSPVENQNLGLFSQATATNRFYEYKYAQNSSNNWVEGYWSVAPGTTSFAAAKGYLIRMPNSINTLPGYADGTASSVFDGTFTGKPNNGNVGIDLSIANNRFTAVGNPYPSPISVSDFFAANNTKLYNATGLYLWRKRNNSASSSYATLSQAGYVANPDDSTTSAANIGSFYQGTAGTWLISQGQGFIVRTSETATTAPQLSFTNSMRRAAPGTTQGFFKSAASADSKLWLNLKATGGTSSQALVAYMAEEGTLDLDYGYDALTLADSDAVSIYSVAQSTPLAIQARPGFDVSDVVPMGFTAPAAGQYTISLDHTEGVFSQGQTIYVRDNAEGIIRNLSENDYAFTTEAGNFEGRFDVIYTTTALGTDNPVVDPNTVVVYKQGTTISINTGSAVMNSVTIFDVRGRQLYSASGINATEASVSNLEIAQQVIIVEIDTVKGKVSKRIVY